MALLVTLQAIAAAALATLGPMHTHRSAPTMLVLEDVRRGPVHGESAEAAALRRHGHLHGSASASRHHHASGDASVEVVEGDVALHAGDADDAGSGSSLGTLIGLVPSVALWLPHDGRSVAATRRAWVPQIHHPDLPERPPRTA